MKDERESTQQSDETAAPEDTPEMALGRTIRKLRESRGISQQDLANAMNTHGFSWRQTTVAKTEAGQRPLRVNETVGLSRIFEISAGDFLTFAEDKSETRRQLHDAHTAERKAKERLAQAERELKDAQEELRQAERMVKLCLRAFELLRREELGWSGDEPHGEG